jgi:transcriptional regulator of arginine metabolism
MISQAQNLVEALKTLLMGRKANTQEDICNALEKLGYEVNQSKVSRLLRKIGAKPQKTKCFLRTPIDILPFLKEADSYGLKPRLD